MENLPLPGFYGDLRATLDHAWASMVHGSVDKKSAFSTPCVATIERTSDGNYLPQQRTLILRNADQKNLLLRFYTDNRSLKIPQIRASTGTSILFYSAPQHLQIRLNGAAQLRTEDALCLQLWNNLAPHGRSSYLSLAAPGTACASLVDCAKQIAHLPTHFCVMDVQIAEIETLYLHRSGNQRASFKYDAQHTLTRSTFLQP